MWSFKFDVIVLSMTKNIYIYIYIYVCVGGEGGGMFYKLRTLAKKLFTSSLRSHTYVFILFPRCTNSFFLLPNTFSFL